MKGKGMTAGQNMLPNIVLITLFPVMSLLLLQPLRAYTCPSILSRSSSTDTVGRSSRTELHPIPQDSSKFLTQESDVRNLVASHDTMSTATNTVTTARGRRSNVPPVAWYDWLLNELGTPLTTIIVGILGSLAAAFVYDRIKGKVKVKIVHNMRQNTVKEIHGFYLDRIEWRERINPIYITHCLETPQLCVKRTGDLKKRVTAKSEQPTFHLLLVAKSDGNIVGLIKALYITSMRVLFIAYVAVQPGKPSTERRAMRKLLESLRRSATIGGLVEWIVFEITDLGDSSSEAKERLFKQYGQTFGVDLKQIDLDYLQPDLDCINLQRSREESALLYIASTRVTPSALESGFVRRLIEAIYFDIYLPTWLINHSAAERPALEHYVKELLEVILQGVPKEIKLI